MSFSPGDSGLKTGIELHNWLKKSTIFHHINSLFPQYYVQQHTRETDAGRPFFIGVVKSMHRWHGIVVSVLSSYERSYPTSGPVRAWMGDRLQAGIPSQYVTSQLYQLGLASPGLLNQEPASAGVKAAIRGG